MDLAAALEDVDALLGGDDGVAVEVGGPLLELGEVFDGLQRTLRTEETLDIHAAERRGLDAMAELLRANVADEVAGAVGVAVDVAVETRDAAAGLDGAAVLGLVELLLREGCDEEAESFDLLGVEDAVEELVIVVNGDDLAF